MKNFKYSQPQTLQEASGILIKNSTISVPFSGGTDVLGLLKDDIITPEIIVNLKKIQGLNTIKYSPGKGLEIGALVTLTDIAEHPVIQNKYTILSDAAKEVATPQFRNVGTLGGNICQRPRCFYFRGDFHCLRKGGDICYAADGNNKYHCILGGGPCFIVHPSDTAVALLALNAKVSIFSNDKMKQIPLSEFFVLPEKNHTKENILESGEIIEKIIIPDLPSNTKSTYIKFKERHVWDFAVVSVGSVILKNSAGIKSGSIAFGGVAPIPWQNEIVNKKLSGLTINDDSLSKLADEMFKNAYALEMNSYKIPLAKNLMKRILTDLTA